MKVPTDAASVIFGLFAISPASAVIVAGTNGTGNNNSTEAGLSSYLASTSYAAFPYWDNQVRVQDASGIYLGYNASTMRGWVLTANHVTTPTTITVAGSSYSVTGSGTRIGSSDIKLYEIGGGALDPSLPNLPTVPLPSVDASLNEFLLMFGRGFTSSTTTPYAWGTPGTSDGNGTRWATNTIEAGYFVNIGTVEIPNVQRYLTVDFDAAGHPGATAYDGQASLGDSGGGIFVHRNGQWELSGIAHFVDDGPDFLEGPPTGDNTVNPSQPGDFSAYSDVKFYKTTIQAITGTLVPEPATFSMLAGGLLLMMSRRRRVGA